MAESKENPTWLRVVQSIARRSQSDGGQTRRLTLGLAALQLVLIPVAMWLEVRAWGFWVVDLTGAQLILALMTFGFAKLMKRG